MAAQMAAQMAALMADQTAFPKAGSLDVVMAVYLVVN